MMTSHATSCEQVSRIHSSMFHHMNLLIVRAGCGLAAGLFHYTGYGSIPILLLQGILLFYYLLSNLPIKIIDKIRVLIAQSLAILISAGPLLFSTVFNKDSLNPDSIEILCWIEIAGLACCICLDTVLTIQVVISMFKSQRR